MLAYAFARPPYLGASKVLERVSPLLCVLMERDDWIRALFEASSEKSIMKSLALGQGLPREKASQKALREIRSEASNLISYAVTSFIFMKRFGYPIKGVTEFYRIEVDATAPMVGMKNSTISAGVRCSTSGPNDLIQLPRGQKLQDGFSRYSKTLRTAAKPAAGSNTTDEDSAGRDSREETGQPPQKGGTLTRQPNIQSAIGLEPRGLRQGLRKRWKDGRRHGEAISQACTIVVLGIPRYCSRRDMYIASTGRW